jgi:hypothetical protein
VVWYGVACEGVMFGVASPIMIIAIRLEYKYTLLQTICVYLPLQLNVFMRCVCV